MFCHFCGAQIEDNALFCHKCGKNQHEVTETDVFKHNEISKKSKPLALLILMILVVIISAKFLNFAPNTVSSSNSIVGVWMCGTQKIVFSNKGDFRMDATYGTYYIDDNNKLEMAGGDYSEYSGPWTYRYSEEAKYDDDYWYISGDNLYFRCKKFTRQ